MLIDLEPEARLLALAVHASQITVLGSGRGGKPREEGLRGNSLAAFAGKRGRKGKPVDGPLKVSGLRGD
jgi:topoisomerase-4 subunit A